MERENDVALWLEHMGFNGKQLSQAAERLGMSRDSLTRRRSGEVDLTLTDRLAMAALRAGLPAWSPETDQEIVQVGELTRLIEDFARRRAR